MTARFESRWGIAQNDVAETLRAQIPEAERLVQLAFHEEVELSKTWSAAGAVKLRLDVAADVFEDDIGNVRMIARTPELNIETPHQLLALIRSRPLDAWVLTGAATKGHHG